MTEDDPEAPAGSDGERTGSRNPGARIAGDHTAFASLTTHFYRAEVDRTTTWRSRLDQTTNWAVVVVAAILTWAFSGSDNPHYVVLIGMFGLVAFLVMEANRYREYDVWRDRVRTLQQELFAEAYAPSGDPETDWRARLAADLREPAFSLSFLQALAHRLRRTYLGLLSILLVAWIARFTVFVPDESWRQTASVLGAPGTAVVAVVAIFYAGLVAVAATSAIGSSVREFQK